MSFMVNRVPMGQFFLPVFLSHPVNALPYHTTPHQQRSTHTLMNVFLLPERQTDKAWESPRKQRSSGDRRALDGKMFALFVVFEVLTHNSGRVTQICVFNTVKLGTSASSP